MANAAAVATRRPVFEGRTSAAGRRSFGGRTTDRETSNEAFVPAEFWVNIGRFVTNPETGQQEFFGLPRGLALDTMQRERGRGFVANEKNDLLDDMLASAEDLAPGETLYVETEGDLVIQLRRVEDRTAEEVERKAQRKPAQLGFRAR